MLCCVCILETSSHMGIFDNVDQQLKIAEVIQKYLLWFKPQPDSGLSTQICKICWHKIYDFHIFCQTVEKAHRDYEQNASTNIKTEISSTNQIKTEDEYGEEEIFNIHDNTLIEPKCELQTRNPLEENYSEMLSIEESDEDFQSSDDYEPSDSSQQESSNEELLKEAEIPQAEKRTKKKQRQKREKGLEKDNPDKVKKKRTVQVQRLDPIRSEEMIKKHIPMGCNLCLFVGTTFADIVQHFKSSHPVVRPYIMCCDKKLTKGYFVAQHAMKHEDPNCFKCEECNKSFASIKGLRAHNLNYHPAKEELVYSCDVCPKKFARGNLLKLHKTSHIPKEQWQYICDICPEKRRFASRYLLNIHTSMRHKRETNVCPVCAKKIKDKKSFEKHVRLHYEDSGPRIKCPYPDCDSWLKDEENLKRHWIIHRSEEKIFKCDQCDKECTNHRALRNHKRYAHTNINFQCDQCDKTFKKSISLREHMTQHTGETLYKCPFCTRTFNSNANMHAHKKKQHPIEWDEWRKTKRGSAQKLINSNNPLNQIVESVTDLNIFK